MAGVTRPKGIDFVVFSHVVIDDLWLADGTEYANLLGGAGAYAAAGAALVSGPGRTGIVSGIGDDFPDRAKRWLRSAGIDDTGMPSVDPHTPRTQIHYFADGEREEAPAHGLEHFGLSEPTFRGLPASYSDALGLYVFKPIDPDFWDSLVDYKNRTGCRVLWEIDAAACSPLARPDVLNQLASVDLLSINETELQLLFADKVELSEAWRVRQLLDAGTREVILRRGSRGASMFDGRREIAASPVRSIVVDPTGAGNAFSGAYLSSWVDHLGDYERILADAMAAAAMVIEQYGPPEFVESTWTRHRTFSREIRGKITQRST